MGLRDILENPPRKMVKHSWCGGIGIVNLRGMIVSDECPGCKGSGEISVIDYDEFEKQVRQALKGE